MLQHVLNLSNIQNRYLDVNHEKKTLFRMSKQHVNSRFNMRRILMQ